jgi:HPt (histidine-containing phosphotransfer) domain-containing protein
MEFVMKIPDELRRKYTERRARDADDLSASLDAGQFDVLARIGHQLKGNASTYGYEELAELGRKMEHAAEDLLLKEARDCLFTLKAWVEDKKPSSTVDG